MRLPVAAWLAKLRLPYAEGVSSGAKPSERLLNGHGRRSFVRFQRDIFEDYGYRPEGQIVAAIDDAWVGLAAVGITREGNGDKGMAGVVSAHRKRGIATAQGLATVALNKRNKSSFKMF